MFPPVCIYQFDPVRGYLVIAGQLIILNSAVQWGDPKKSSKRDMCELRYWEGILLCLYGLLFLEPTLITEITLLKLSEYIVRLLVVPKEKVRFTFLLGVVLRYFFQLISYQEHYMVKSWNDCQPCCRMVLLSSVNLIEHTQQLDCVHWLIITTWSKTGRKLFGAAYPEAHICLRSQHRKTHKIRPLQPQKPAIENHQKNKTCYPPLKSTTSSTLFLYTRDYIYNGRRTGDRGKELHVTVLVARFLDPNSLSNK
ncbi:hypothetical protein PROFUN_15350 [Planoprotostelium fungivorum]|uniref:Uncharacterized protein n=1 Tax=Planoprotostelium fungivorum TaxID=1890364 RepID=A0A2P6MWL9_9EUKA|nr:hypothetical protein PROFUN_15350 [Planoprotostelium fungivorum]